MLRQNRVNFNLKQLAHAPWEYYFSKQLRCRKLFKAGTVLKNSYHLHSLPKLYFILSTLHTFLFLKSCPYIPMKVLIWIPDTEAALKEVKKLILNPIKLTRHKTKWKISHSNFNLINKKKIIITIIIVIIHLIIVSSLLARPLRSH